jgi:hypothetical protein
VPALGALKVTVTVPLVVLVVELWVKVAFALVQLELKTLLPEAMPNEVLKLLVDAGLGQREDALREGRRAIELLPVEKDSINGVHMIEHFAIIAAWAGEKDLACEQLAIVTRLPGYVS